MITHLSIFSTHTRLGAEIGETFAVAFTVTPGEPAGPEYPGSRPQAEIVAYYNADGDRDDQRLSRRLDPFADELEDCVLQHNPDETFTTGAPERLGQLCEV